MDFFGYLTIIQLVILLSLGICPMLESTPSIITSDKEALISFKSQIFFELPNPLSTWDQNQSPCNWSGVSCNKHGERVVGLHLSGLKLTGFMSPHIGNLSFLRSLELQNNQLTAKLPDQLGNLVSLRMLNLSFNSLEGDIPSNMTQCKGLRIFDLMQNKISGEIPEDLSHLTQLQVLNLGKNQLSGVVPSSLANISSLVNLNLGTNKLGGSIPSDFARLVNLKFLDLSINNLSGTVPSSMYNMSSLVQLALYSNDLWGELPGDIGLTMPNLLAFSFCLNKFTGSFESLKGQHQMISYRELRLSTDNFKEENLIGHGSFGFVYKGLLHGATIAVKVLDTTMSRSWKIFLGECAALRHVRHRNLVKLITICSSIDYKNEEILALIFEFMSNGSLHDWLTGNRRYANGMGLNIFDRLNCAIGIASAIDYLHNETKVPIVHCDLKPGNVLLDSDMTPKVADFGLAKLLLNGNDNEFSISSTHTLRGSIGYIPPEYSYGRKPSTAGDVYSYGILLLELFTGRSPTHEIFTEGLSLKSWVQNEFPNNLEQVLELELLEQMNIFWEKGQCSKIESRLDCLITIFGVGLSCTADSPDARVSIRDVLRKLRNVEDILPKSEFFENKSY
ncbi:hypothetical protein Pfo_021960 [Paulownia fortunei]|nr:hypothetical protein Pfo_021960 [Paulownia fortunei]